MNNKDHRQHMLAPIVSAAQSAEHRLCTLVAAALLSRISNDAFSGRGPSLGVDSCNSQRLMLG